MGVCTFRAESRQLVTEAFPPPRGHDQEHIPAGQRQVNRPELQRAEPRQMEGVLQMLHHLLGPWEIYQTRAKKRAVRSGPFRVPPGGIYRAGGGHYPCHRSAASPACWPLVHLGRPVKRRMVARHHRLPPDAAVERPYGDAVQSSSAAAQQSVGQPPLAPPPPYPTVPAHLKQKTVKTVSKGPSLRHHRKVVAVFTGSSLWNQSEMLNTRSHT